MLLFLAFYQVTHNTTFCPLVIPVKIVVNCDPLLIYTVINILLLT